MLSVRICALNDRLISNKNNKNQDYEAVVSIFSQESGLVRSLEHYRNSSKESEINVVRFLVGKLQDMGLTVYLDALHTQKKL